MTTRIEMVTVDAIDARSLASWWARVTGGAVEDGFEDDFVSVSLPGGGPRLGFQRVLDRTEGKNRVHVDLHVADRELSAGEYQAAGATFVARHDVEGFGWIVLADPEGNQFCLSQS